MSTFHHGATIIYNIKFYIILNYRFTFWGFFYNNFFNFSWFSFFFSFSVSMQKKKDRHKQKMNDEKNFFTIFSFSKTRTSVFITQKNKTSNNSKMRILSTFFLLFLQKNLHRSQLSYNYKFSEKTLCGSENTFLDLLYPKFFHYY